MPESKRYIDLYAGGYKDPEEKQAKAEMIKRLTERMPPGARRLRAEHLGASAAKLQDPEKDTVGYDHGVNGTVQGRIDRVLVSAHARDHHVHQEDHKRQCAHQKPRQNCQIVQYVKCCSSLLAHVCWDCITGKENIQHTGRV